MKKGEKNLSFCLAEQAAKQVWLQAKQVWQDLAKQKLPAKLLHPQHLVIAGMGGSGLAGALLQEVLLADSSLPVIAVNDYHLPAWVGSQDLVVVCSYSGGTQEMLNLFKEAHQRRAKLIVITSGGPLARLAATQADWYYQFSPLYNPADVPNFGIAYQFAALLWVAKQLKINHFSWMETVQELTPDKLNQQWHQAQKLTEKVAKKGLLVIAGSQLAANAHVLANQLNEISKHYANYGCLPEINHHLLEGLSFPSQITQNLNVLFLLSAFDSPEIKQRCRLTKQVLQKQKITCYEISFSASNLLTQSFYALAWSVALAVLVAEKKKNDPLSLPWVKYFKQQLAKAAK